MSGDLEDFDSELLLTDDVNGDGDDEEVTAQKVLETIEEAWLNEKFSPEILPHKLEFVDCMLEQIKYMESNISNLPKEDYKGDIHRIELERIRYIVTSYLRCRLKKIETFAFHILEQEAEREPDSRYLSEGELKFAREYVQNMDNHLNTVVKDMPWNLQTLELANKRIKPFVDSYVFLRTKSCISNVIIKDKFENREEEVTLNENSQHLLPYSSIADYVKNGSVQLI